jgi:hypothetical protein
MQKSIINNDCLYTTQGNLICKQNNDNKYEQKSTFVNFPVSTPDSDLIGINTRFRPIDQEEIIPKMINDIKT